MCRWCCWLRLLLQLLAPFLRCTHHCRLCCWCCLTISHPSLSPTPALGEAYVLASSCCKDDAEAHQWPSWMKLKNHSAIQCSVDSYWSSTYPYHRRHSEQSSIWNIKKKLKSRCSKLNPFVDICDCEIKQWTYLFGVSSKGFQAM